MRKNFYIALLTPVTLNHNLFDPDHIRRNRRLRRSLALNHNTGHVYTASDFTHFDDMEPDEETSLLRDNASSPPDFQVPLRIARRLYVSHFLSTWNSRVFEFGAVLYLATIFPGTLLPMSVYAFTRGVAGILFAPAMGQYIDRGNRLQVVRVSIVWQRFLVAGSCAVFYILIKRVPLGPQGEYGMLSLLAVLACIEKLCSILNLVSVEKDWVVVVAGKNPEALRRINAQMRRIDLVCKLLGPLFIALVDGASTEIAIIVNFGMNIASVLIEYFAIARVYWEIPALHQSKLASALERPLSPGADGSEDRQASESMLAHNWRHVVAVARKSATDSQMYFNHRAFLPSFGGALLYLTVLNFGAQMVTYLLAAGYTSAEIGVARTLSVSFEVLATFIAPWLMGRIGSIRAGSWHSSWQVLTLGTGYLVFMLYYSTDSLFSAGGLVVGTIVSRVGLRGFDLCVQAIVQNDVEADRRGAFSTIEAAWQNWFELVSYASTMVFSQPGAFRWPVLLSTLAVSMASACYAAFVRIRRGHLIHWEKATFGSAQRKRQDRDNVAEGIA